MLPLRQIMRDRCAPMNLYQHQRLDAAVRPAYLRRHPRWLCDLDGLAFDALKFGDA